LAIVCWHVTSQGFTTGTQDVAQLLQLAAVPGAQQAIGQQAIHPGLYSCRRAPAVLCFLSPSLFHLLLLLLLLLAWVDGLLAAISVCAAAAHCHACSCLHVCSSLPNLLLLLLLWVIHPRAAGGGVVTGCQGIARLGVHEAQDGTPPLTPSQQRHQLLVPDLLWVLQQLQQLCCHLLLLLSICFCHGLLIGRG
jgi:hypothetical protein